jgi:mono/diheme cytochrome c family protein
LRVRETIERGVPDTFMPAWGQAYGGPLNDQELDAVTFYILSWQSGSPIYVYPTQTPRPSLGITPPPGIDGDPNRGAVQYENNCALCHGQNGEGRIGANLAKPWPSVRPDLRVKSVIEKGVEGAVMPPFSQDHGGPLTDQDINDITSYILTWSGAGTDPETQEPSIGPLTGWPVWLIFIGVFIFIVVAIAYFSRQKSSED